MQFLITCWHYYLLLWQGNAFIAVFLHVVGILLCLALAQDTQHRPDHHCTFDADKSEPVYALESVDEIVGYVCTHPGCDAILHKELMNEPSCTE